MPITLPPITRRRFIKGAFAGAAAMSLPRFAWSSPASNVDPDRLVLLSDIHIHASKTTDSHGINMWNNLQSVCDQVLRLDPVPAAVLVNGDCAFNNGHADDYKTFVEGVSRLREAGLPLHLGVGNHDDRDNFWKAVPSDVTREPLMEHRQVLMLPLPNADWYMLDSLDQTAHTPGILGPEQIAWLARSLDKAPNRPAVVMVHHQPNTEEEKKIGGLTDTQAFLDVVLPRRQVKAIVFGHTHVWRHFVHEKLHFINLPTTAYVFHHEQPAGWVDAHLGTTELRLQLNALDPTHPQHKELLTFPWR